MKLILKENTFKMNVIEDQGKFTGEEENVDYSKILSLYQFKKMETIHKNLGKLQSNFIDLL